MEQFNSEIVWFSVDDAIPNIGKEVLVSDGSKVSASKIKSIEMSNDGRNLEVYWEGGRSVTRWAFMPLAPAAATQSGPSVW